MSRQLVIEDAAYLAGFIDGEGSIMLYRRPPARVAVIVSVSNTDFAVLEWIAGTTGVGAVVKQRAEGERNRATAMWRCNADAAESLLVQIRPYLKVKAGQADLALEVQARLRDPALKADPIWQDEYRERMKQMNRRGPRSTYDMTSTSGG